MAGGAARRSCRRRSRNYRMVRSRLGRRRRRHHPACFGWRGDSYSLAKYFCFSVRTWSGFLRRANTGRIVRPPACPGGSEWSFFGIFCNQWFPEVSADPRALAVAGMAAFFTGVVRAPLTGIVLVIEMTASFTLLLPMLSACFAAMVVPTLLANAPIYDSLL